MENETFSWPKGASLLMYAGQWDIKPIERARYSQYKQSSKAAEPAQVWKGAKQISTSSFEQSSAKKLYLYTLHLHSAGILKLFLLRTETTLGDLRIALSGKLQYKSFLGAHELRKCHSRELQNASTGKALSARQWPKFYVVLHVWATGHASTCSEKAPRFSSHHGFNESQVESFANIWDEYWNQLFSLHCIKYADIRSAGHYCQHFRWICIRNSSKIRQVKEKSIPDWSLKE